MKLVYTNAVCLLLQLRSAYINKLFLYQALCTAFITFLQRVWFSIRCHIITVVNFLME